MLSPVNISLSEFHISPKTGFINDEAPLRRLPDSYYEPWETIGENLPELIKSVSIREKVKQLPVLSPSKLRTETEWRRAYMLLSYMTQGYIWAGATPAEVLPAAISCPFVAISSHLGLPPVATCAALNLWNFAPLSSSDIISDPDNLIALLTFTGTRDEVWFYVVSDAMEARGGSMIPVMLGAMESAETGDTGRVSEALCTLTECLKELEALLGRMYEKCDPNVFYNDIRPWLTGSKNASTVGLPRGVFYDEGEGRGSWQQLSGASNAQSSLLPFFDIVLGVEHHATGKPMSTKGNPFMKEMRGYMPRQHARFLEQLCPNTVRHFVMSHGTGHPIIGDYNSAVAALASFRNKHLQIVTRYVILPAKSKSRTRSKSMEEGLTSSTHPETADNSGGNALLGTAGAVLVPFLKQARDETKASVIESPQ